MRLREPFQGYKLSSGHPMFHIAYLIGSFIAVKYVLDKSDSENSESMDVLNQLNIAHLLVPCFNLVSYFCNKYEHFVTARVLDTISIFQYQATIFYAQFHQQN